MVFHYILSIYLSIYLFCFFEAEFLCEKALSVPELTL